MRLFSLPGRCEVDTLEPRRRGTMPHSSPRDYHLDILSKLAWLESGVLLNDTEWHKYTMICMKYGIELKYRVERYLVCLWVHEYEVQSRRFCYSRSITSTWMFLVQNDHLSNFKPPCFISNRWRIAKPLEWIDRITFSKVFPSSWQRCHTWLRQSKKGDSHDS